MDDTRALFLRLKSTAKISDNRSVSKISPFLFWDHGTSHLGKKAKGNKFYTDLTEVQVTIWWGKWIRWDRNCFCCWDGNGHLNIVVIWFIWIEVEFLLDLLGFNLFFWIKVEKLLSDLPKQKFWMDPCFAGLCWIAMECPRNDAYPEYLTLSGTSIDHKELIDPSAKPSQTSQSFTSHPFRIANTKISATFGRWRQCSL